MDDELKTKRWLTQAMTVLQRVADADSRFSASIGVNSVSLLSAADELQVATWDATLWTAMNACPDVELGERVALMLNTYAAVAITAQRAITNPSSDSDAAFGRIGDLLAVVDVQSQTLDAW
jgi:hypothetical protein